MAHQNNHPEANHKQPTITESVDDLIHKKQAEKESEVSSSAKEKMADIQGEVAEVMGGVEKPSEKISERKGESGEKGDLKGGIKGDDDDQVQAISYSIKDYTFPSEEVMVRKIRSAITAQIKLEWKKAKKASSQLGTGESASYNEAIARIRKLKLTLSSLFHSTVQFLKQMYVDYFTPDGKRRNMEDL